MAWDHYVEINWDRFGAEKHLFLLYLKTPENYLIEGQKPIKSAQFNYKIKINSMMQNFDVAIVAEDGTQISKANLVVELSILKNNYHFANNCDKDVLRHFSLSEQEPHLLMISCHELKKSRLQITAKDFLNSTIVESKVIPYETSEDIALKLAQSNSSDKPFKKEKPKNSSLSLNYHLIDSSLNDFSSIGIEYQNLLYFSSFELLSMAQMDIFSLVGNTLSPKENKLYQLQTLLGHRALHFGNFLIPRLGVNFTHLSLQDDFHESFLSMPIAFEFHFSKNFQSTLTFSPLSSKNNFFAFGLNAKYNWENMFTEAGYQKTSFDKKSWDLTYDCWELKFGRHF